MIDEKLRQELLDAIREVVQQALKEAIGPLIEAELKRLVANRPYSSGIVFDRPRTPLEAMSRTMAAQPLPEAGKYREVGSK